MKPRINCSEQFFSKSRKKIQKFSNIDVLTTSQRKKLPSGNFKFLPEPEKIGRELIEKYNPEDKVGYIMKVDLVSKKNLGISFFDLFNDQFLKRWLVTTSYFIWQLFYLF